IINPLLADEQVRGGVVQGIGAALFEHCRYSEIGQLTNASLADYLLPMAPEMPDIHIDHVARPSARRSWAPKALAKQARSVPSAPYGARSATRSATPVRRWSASPSRQQTSSRLSIRNPEHSDRSRPMLRNPRRTHAA